MLFAVSLSPLHRFILWSFIYAQWLEPDYKRWERGISLTEAHTIFEADRNDIRVPVNVLNTPEKTFTIIKREITFFENELYFFINNELRKLEIPMNAIFEGIYKNHVLLHLNSN